MVKIQRVQTDKDGSFRIGHRIYRLARWIWLWTSIVPYAAIILVNTLCSIDYCFNPELDGFFRSSRCTWLSDSLAAEFLDYKVVFFPYVVLCTITVGVLYGIRKVISKA